MPIVDDALEEEIETFTIVLSNATGGATLGLTRQSTVRIQDNEVPLHLGLVTYYPFNGNANDVSGVGNHGTVYGAVLAADRFGQTNACYRFNGTSAYIKAAAAPLPSGVRTVSLWFYAETVQNQPILLGYGGNDCGQSFYMGLNLSRSAAYFVSPHCATFDLIQPFHVSPVNQ